MQTFTLNNAGLMPGIQFRPTMHNLHGIPVGIAEQQKASSVLVITPKLAEASPEGIVHHCSIIRDGGAQYLGLECLNDNDECLVLLSYGRGLKPVKYVYQTPGKPMVPLATLVEGEDSPVIEYGFSHLPQDNMGFEAVVKLSMGDKIVCQTPQEVPFVLTWTGRKLSKKNAPWQLPKTA